MELIYNTINFYGDRNYFQLNHNFRNIFEINLTFIPRPNFYQKNVVGIIVTSIFICRNKYSKSIRKESLSYHKSFKSMKLTDFEIDFVINEGLVLSKYWNIKYMPIKLGKLRVAYKLLREYEEEDDDDDIY